MATMPTVCVALLLALVAGVMSKCPNLGRKDCRIFQELSVLCGPNSACDTGFECCTNTACKAFCWPLYNPQVRDVDALAEMDEAQPAERDEEETAERDEDEAAETDDEDDAETDDISEREDAVEDQAAESDKVEVAAREDGDDDQAAESDNVEIVEREDDQALALLNKRGFDAFTRPPYGPQCPSRGNVPNCPAGLTLLCNNDLNCAAPQICCANGCRLECLTPFIPVTTTTAAPPTLAPGTLRPPLQRFIEFARNFFNVGGFRLNGR